MKEADVFFSGEVTLNGFVRVFLFFLLNLNIFRFLPEIGHLFRSLLFFVTMYEIQIYRTLPIVIHAIPGNHGHCPARYFDAVAILKRMSRPFTQVCSLRLLWIYLHKFSLFEFRELYVPDPVLSGMTDWIFIARLVRVSNFS